MRPMNEATVGSGVNGRPGRRASGDERLSSGKKTITTTTTIVEESKVREQPAEEVALVQDLGKQVDWSAASGPIRRAQQQRRESTGEQPLGVDGNKLVTTIGTIVAQSSQTRVVVVLLKDGEDLQLKTQEMRPSVFEVGANLREAQKYLDEQQRVMENLERQRQAPLECWMSKYKKICDEQERQTEREMSAQMKLVFMCMAENLQGCWRALWWQLEQRLRLLRATCDFYGPCERLVHALDQADTHVQLFRQAFLDGPGCARFSEAADELKRLNSLVLGEYISARQKQRQLLELIDRMAAGNMGDARQNYLVSDARNLTNLIANYLEPLERRKLQLENMIKTTSTITTTTTNISSKSNQRLTDKESKVRDENHIPAMNIESEQANGAQRTKSIRQIGDFNDLNLVENWLNLKSDQLNSSLLSSLGFSVQDTRSILNKHEQIALECSAIEEATANFRGKNIHALKWAAHPQSEAEEESSLFWQQKSLATRARDVITILDERIALLRRTIDFYSRAKEASADINKWMRRLQVDDSLQSVQFVANELELKDVSAVVASGATILSELQQLQLAQQQGQRSNIVNLNLTTKGIRAVIDQLSQNLAHLKTVLSQRRLILLNEDASKMASNFSNKCRQLQFWLNNQAGSYLLSNNRIGFDASSVKSYISGHQQLRAAIQSKTPEVEALLRLLPTTTESMAAKSGAADEIQRDTDELRRGWINATNCLDKRIDLAAKFLDILEKVGHVGRQLDLLGASLAPDGPPPVADAGVRAQVERSLLQLEDQVRSFSQDAPKASTGLEPPLALETKEATNDINKQQIVAHANGSLRLLNERHRSTLTKLNAMGRGPPPAPSQRVGPWSPTFREQPQQPVSELSRSPASSEVNKSASGTSTATGEKGASLVGPRFVRSLSDQLVEPFSTIQLECETDPKTSAGSKIEWSLNNNRRIPASIKHSILNDGNKHKLVISQFNPTCCGTYTARATNLETGQSASTSCRLRLAGIKEADNSDSDGFVSQQQRPLQSSSNAMERIIQGVDSPASFDEQTPERVIVSTRRQARVQLGEPQEPAATKRAGAAEHTTHNANNNSFRMLGDNCIVEPAESTPTGARSLSRSSFEGTPQAPVFVRDLADSMSGSCSRAGLVCVVVGNPPPTVEWLHNSQPIAEAKCPRQQAGNNANLCKLTIATMDDKMQGRYVCRASNRLGQSSTALTLNK